jgi:hypothetical protein
VIDHLPKYRRDLYHKEVSYDVEDNLLQTALEAFDMRPDLIILDSAGHMGFIEFMYLMKRIPQDHECLLALDDIDHVKHFDTMEMIRKNSGRFEILWQVALHDPQGGENWQRIIKIKSIVNPMQL